MKLFEENVKEIFCGYVWGKHYCFLEEGIKLLKG